MSKTRTNLLPNPRFKNTHAGWVATSGATITDDLPNNRILITASAAKVSGSDMLLSPTSPPAVAVATGDVVSFGVVVSVPLGSPSLRLSAGLANLPTITTTLGTPIIIAAGQTVRLLVQGKVIAAGTTGLRMVIRTNDAFAIGSKFYASQPIVEKRATVGDYFDGASTTSLSETYFAWTGTADASPSTRIYSYTNGVRGVVFSGAEKDAQIRGVIISGVEVPAKVREVVGYSTVNPAALPATLPFPIGE